MLYYEYICSFVSLSLFLWKTQAPKDRNYGLFTAVLPVPRTMPDNMPLLDG